MSEIDGRHEELLDYTYGRLAAALEYPEEQLESCSLWDILEDTLHMIELGHRYLDLEEY